MESVIKITTSRVSDDVLGGIAQRCRIACAFDHIGYRNAFIHTPAIDFIEEFHYEGIGIALLVWKY